MSGNGSRPARILRSDVPVEWAVSDLPVDYLTAVAQMEARAEMIARGEAAEFVWLLEHPPLYTAGTSTNDADLLAPDRFPVHRTGRGGQLTYHGPGQRIAYVMLDLGRRGRDVRAFVGALEAWVIETLDRFNVKGETRADRVGVWVRRPERSPGAEDKIAALGIRLKRWVSLHGLSINVEPELEHFSGIVPCGVVGNGITSQGVTSQGVTSLGVTSLGVTSLGVTSLGVTSLGVTSLGVTSLGVTSLADLGLIVSMAEVDMALAETFNRRFGPIQKCPPPIVSA